MPTERYVLLIPTDDPKMWIEVTPGSDNNPCAYVKSPKLPRGVRNAIMPGQREAAAHAAKERGLRLKGRTCLWRRWEDLSDSDKAGIEQDVMSAEMGWDTPQFDDPESRGRGRPALPADQQRQRRTVGMTEEKWEYCRKQPGGAADFINRLVDAYRAEA